MRALIAAVLLGRAAAPAQAQEAIQIKVRLMKTLHTVHEGRAPTVIGTNSMRSRWSFATASATICDRSVSRSYRDANLPRTF